VADRGIGLDETTEAALFTPFYRSKAAKAVASGTGLGLTAVKRMVESLGGSVRGVNRDDGSGGALFQCLIPIAERLP
jgi:K+-sensing histidine kinase KdpD